MTSARLTSGSSSTNHSSTLSLKRARSRNDSSNVSSLLAPEASERRTKPCIYSSGNQKLQRLHKVHCESCYCRDDPILPLLRLPLKRQPEENRFSRDALPLKQHQGVCFHRYGENSQEIISNSEEEEEEGPFKSVCQHLDKSQRRPPAAIHDDEKVIEPREFKVSVACQTHDEEVLDEAFEKVSAFRKDRYFDCHSLQNLPEEAPAHKCVHKFTVSDRLMLEPINCDSFGVSCCEICSKPMQHCRKSPTTEQKPINNTKKLYEHDLVPPSLNMGSGGERIEIKVPEGISRECFSSTDSVWKSKRYVPLGNSFALRFQKRRI